MVRFYVRKSTESVIQNESVYDFTRHQEFIGQQLNEGKKVIVVAHG